MEHAKKQRILLVEDSMDLQELTKELLESEGYEVICANNGLEAINWLHQNTLRPDLILLDLMMPVMDGYQFRKLQMVEPPLAAIPVVVVSADGNAKAKAEQIKANDFFNKAGGIEDLLEVIKRNIAGKLV